jgi:hypothetical protein
VDYYHDLLDISVFTERDADDACRLNTSGIQPKHALLDSIPYIPSHHPAFVAMMSCLRGGSLSHLLAQVEKVQVYESFPTEIFKVQMSYQSHPLSPA